MVVINYDSFADPIKLLCRSKAHILFDRLVPNIYTKILLIYENNMCYVGNDSQNMLFGLEKRNMKKIQYQLPLHNATTPPKKVNNPSCSKDNAKIETR